MLEIATAIVLGVWYLLRRKSGERPYVQIVVLGEVGHSPRMQYHAHALSVVAQARVDIFGFPGSQLIGTVVADPNIGVFYLSRFRSPFNWIPYVVYAVCKIVFESCQLFWLLAIRTPKSQIILVQSPPAIPTILICKIVSLVRGSALVIDFHNLGFTLLKGKISRDSAMMTAIEVSEKFSAQMCDQALCVSRAMKKFLRETWKLERVTVLYDRPGPQFCGRIAAAAKNELFARLKIPSDAKLIVSATSWTEDEDFGMVIDALPILEKNLLASEKLIFFITGKGAGREHFEKSFSALKLQKISLRTGWLEAGDYPKLLGAADVGFCVHASSSGLDLPMKVVDMLGAELPVAALEFPAISELLQNGELGITFSDAEGLASGILELLRTKEKSGNFSAAAKKWRESNFLKTWEDDCFKQIKEYL